jgi:hypothetical protein
LEQEDLIRISKFFGLSDEIHLLFSSSISSYQNELNLNNNDSRLFSYQKLTIGNNLKQIFLDSIHYDVEIILNSTNNKIKRLKKEKIIKSHRAILRYLIECNINCIDCNVRANFSKINKPHIKYV